MVYMINCQFPVPSCMNIALASETLVQAASIAWRAAASLSKAWMRSSGEREAIEAKRSWVVEAKGQKQTQKVPSNKWIVFKQKWNFKE